MSGSREWEGVGEEEMGRGGGDWKWVRESRVKKRGEGCERKRGREEECEG